MLGIREAEKLPNYSVEISLLDNSSSRLNLLSSSISSSSSSSSPSTENDLEGDEGVLLDASMQIKIEVKGDDLTSLLPLIKKLVEAYVSLKEEQWIKTYGDIPLNKLIATTVTSEEDIRRIIQELKESKDALTHGAVKKLREIMGDNLGLSSGDEEEKSIGTFIFTALLQKAQEFLTKIAEVPVTATATAIKSFTGISVQNQKKIVHRLTSAVAGKTKAQHIVEVIDSCIQAKDCKGAEKVYSSLITQIYNIINIHVPTKNNFKRIVIGRNVNFEQIFWEFGINAITFIENIKKLKCSPRSLGIEPQEKEEEKKNIDLLKHLEETKKNLEEEKKIREQNEKKSQEKIIENTRDYEAKLALEAEVRASLKEELKVFHLNSSALMENSNDSNEFFSHIIELKNSQNKCFLLFAGTGGSSGLCVLLGVGISTWWLIPVGLFIGSGYYAYNSYKEHLQAEILEEKVTLQKKSILENSTAILMLKLKNHEQKDQERKSTTHLPEIQPCLGYLNDLLKSVVITNAPKKIQQEIYGIFQNALNTLKLEPITEKAIGVKIHGACENLAQERQRNRPYFFGKTQHQEIDEVVAKLKLQVQPHCVREVFVSGSN